ncbi:hypothetical protein B484DRAFT_464478 [Ochromonadaceae sp. CCMP2298]|nr:hypothetical protein B484DRAFT_464478 [Ochromonadaceae sp. CCMP2298]
MSSNEIRLRRVARNLYYRKRHLAATSNEQVEAREMKRGLQIMMVMVAKERKSRNTDQGKLRRLKRYLKIMIVQYIMQNVEDPDDLPAQPSRRCRIQDFHPSVCKTFFRFKQGGLYKLYELLRIPGIVRFLNRSKMSGEEVLLRGLFELATGMNQEIACITVFGGLKHQTVDNAWGMTVNMYGPTSLRRYDTTLLGLSDINVSTVLVGQQVALQLLLRLLSRSRGDGTAGEGDL